MQKNIACPTCGAKMEQEEYPKRYVCPYCDEVVYPEKEEKKEESQPTTQPIYVPNEELIAQSVAKRLAAEQKAKEIEEEESENSSNSGCTALIWIILVIGAIVLIASF